MHNHDIRQTIKMVTAPAEEPISLEEAKLHLKIDPSLDESPATDPEDVLILAMAKAARRWAEQYQNRLYITQTWVLYQNRFPPCDRYIEIPRPPLQAINALVYLDADGDEQTVSFIDPSGTALTETDDYIVDTTAEPGRLYLKNGKAWPTALLQEQSIAIEFVAGYGDATKVPDETKAAICLKLSDLYENRGDAAVAKESTTAKALLEPDRIMRL